MQISIKQHGKKPVRYSYPFYEKTITQMDEIFAYYKDNQHVIVILTNERKQSTELLLKELERAHIKHLRTQGYDIYVHNSFTEFMDDLREKLSPLFDKGDFCFCIAEKLDNLIEWINDNYSKRAL